MGLNAKVAEIFCTDFAVGSIPTSSTFILSRYRLVWYGTCPGSRHNGGSNPST